MKRHLLITNLPIDESALLAQRQLTGGTGAVVYFLGVVRDREGEAAIRALEYEAFKEMAEHQFNLLFDEMEKRWPIQSVRVVHRVGAVPVLDLHTLRPIDAEALAACQWLIDELKRVVPIWKKPLH